MDTNNHLLDSLVEIGHASLASDIKLAHDRAVKQFGDRYHEAMAVVAKSVYGLMSECNPGTSFVEAAVIMYITPMDDDDKMDAEDQWMFLAVIYYYATEVKPNEEP